MRNLPDRRLTTGAVILLAWVVSGVALSHAAGPDDEPALTWRVAELAFGCEAGVSTEQPRDGDASLKLRTQTDDPAAWLTFVLVKALRADGQPLGRLGDLVDGGSLSVDLFRHPDSGQGLPDYTLPLITLHVRTPDGEEAVLLWESAYNGYSPQARAVVPEGRWLDDLPIHDGVVWMRYQGRNYNRGAGFRSLDVYAAGHQMTHAGLSSLRLGPDTQVMAIGVGSGPNLSGLLLAYADDIRLSFANGRTYLWNFEPAADGGKAAGTTNP